MGSAAEQIVLKGRGLGKRFGPTLALHNVDLTLRAGEVHVLMGQNGAGKSTLIRLLTGADQADTGSITLAGRKIAPATPVQAQRAGISTVYQEVNLCPNLSVAENLYAGRYPRRRGWAGIDWRKVREGARALLAELGVELDVDAPLASFPVAIQQMAAIARALAVSARVLILDEPTSSLDEGEVKELFAVIARLRKRGLAILFVTHFLDQVYAIGERITVLRNGCLVGEYTPLELPPAALVTAMVGREVELADRERAQTAPSDAAAPVLHAHGLGQRGKLHPLDLHIARGEILGLAGLLGAGRTELARLLFGLERAGQGTLQLDGETVHWQHPADAIARGLALCPEERKTDGIIAELSVRENIVLALQAKLGWWRFLSRSVQQALAARWVEMLGIKTHDLDTPVGLLSGGNQQKVVLARWLASEPQVLILDEPTRGIDIAAKQDIMREVLGLAKHGMAVLFISADIDEVLRLCDRILVLRERRLVGELPGGCSQQELLALMAGG